MIPPRSLSEWTYRVHPLALVRDGLTLGQVVHQRAVPRDGVAVDDHAHGGRADLLAFEGRPAGLGLEVGLLELGRLAFLEQDEIGIGTDLDPALAFEPEDCRWLLA